MKLLPIAIQVNKVITEDSATILYEHNLKINYSQQKYVLKLINEKIEEIVRDFDLSTHEGKRMTNIDETNKGRRVELINTDDPYTKLRPGSRGTYDHLWGGNQHCIKWDDGSSLMLIEGKDSFKFVEG